MLKIGKTKEITKTNIEIDYYIPFRISFSSNEIEDSICWRIGDFNKSLLEFSIGQDSRLLKKIVLVASSKVSLSNENLGKIIGTECGIPTIEFQDMKNQMVYDNPINFNTVLGNDFIKVFWSEKTCNQLKFDRVLIGIDENKNLTSIIISDLSDFEHKELKDGFKL